MKYKDKRLKVSSISISERSGIHTTVIGQASSDGTRTYIITCVDEAGTVGEKIRLEVKSIPISKGSEYILCRIEWNQSFFAEYLMDVSDEKKSCYEVHDSENVRDCGSEEKSSAILDRIVL